MANKPERYDLYCFGNTTHDHLFRIGRYTAINGYGVLTGQTISYGGKGPNVAYAASQFLNRVGVTLTIGSDFEEIGYLDHMKRSNIFFDSRNQFATSASTPRFYSIFDGTNHLTFTASGDGASSYQDPSAFCLATLEQVRSKIVYTCLGNQNANLRILESVKRRTTSLTAYNVTDSVFDMTADQMGKLLRFVDILFLNGEEYRYLTGLMKSGMNKIKQRHGIQIVAVTLGEEGCRIYSGSEEHHVPTDAVADVVDPIGAGDSYAGTFLAYYLKTRDTFVSSEMATKAARLCVQKLGAQIDLGETLE